MSQDTDARELARLARIKKQQKKLKFIRPEAWRYKRIKPSWRRPIGLDNRVKRRLKGYIPMPDSCYRTPKKLRYLHPSGKEEYYVRNIYDLSRVYPGQVIRISSKIGARKKEEIISQAKILDLHILNPIHEEIKAMEIGPEIEEELDYSDLELEDILDEKSDSKGENSTELVDEDKK